MTSKVCTLIVLICLVLGCQKTTFHLYSPDKSQCITVLTFGTYRYIVDGDYQWVPDSNFIKLDISRISRLGDALFVCWENESYEWELLSPKAIILDNKLDTTRYKFSHTHQTDVDGNQEILKYHQEGCFEFGYYSQNIYPMDGAILE